MPFKTTMTVEILSAEKFDPDWCELKIYDIIKLMNDSNGKGSMRWTIKSDQRRIKNTEAMKEFETTLE